jgi:hypothetical protein
LSSLPEMTAAHALYAASGFRRAPELDWNPVPRVRLWAFRLVSAPPRRPRSRVEAGRSDDLT